MLKPHFRLVLVLLLLLGFFLRSTDYTSADLFAERTVKNNHVSAVAITFSSVNTANNSALNRLFDVSGIVPGGFAVSALRLRKDNSSTFKYYLRPKITAGNPDFCRSLDIDFMFGNSFKYQGPLMGLNLESFLGPTSPEDWVAFLRLKEKNNSFVNQVCQFDLVFSTYNSPDPPPRGIFADRLLTSYITSSN